MYIKLIQWHKSEPCIPFIKWKPEEENCMYGAKVSRIGFAPAGETLLWVGHQLGRREICSVSVPAIDLLYDLISLLCFLSTAKNISSPKKQLLLLVLLEHGWAVCSQNSQVPDFPWAIMTFPGLIRSGAFAWSKLTLFVISSVIDKQGLENSSSPVVPAPSQAVLVQKGNLSVAYNPQSIIYFIFRSKESLISIDWSENILLGSPISTEMKNNDPGGIFKVLCDVELCPWVFHWDEYFPVSLLCLFLCQMWFSWIALRESKIFHLRKIISSGLALALFPSDSRWKPQDLVMFEWCVHQASPEGHMS